MELYTRYINERLNQRIHVEEGKGFIVYQIQGAELYLADIFVDKEYRNKGVLFDMVKKVRESAVEEGCTYATAGVAPPANGSTDSLMILLGCGFKLLEARANYIILKKELLSKEDIHGQTSTSV